MEHEMVRMDGDGSFVLPEVLRRAANIQPNEVLFVSVENDEILIQTQVHKERSEARRIAASVSEFSAGNVQG